MGPFEMDYDGETAKENKHSPLSTARKEETSRHLIAGHVYCSVILNANEACAKSCSYA